MTKKERQKLMRSEARFERKRGMRTVLLSEKGGRLFKYFVIRKNFWGRLITLEFYNLMKNEPAFALMKFKLTGRFQ